MDVNGPGATAPVLPPLPAAARLLGIMATLPQGSGQDSVSSLLDLISTPQIRQLLESIETRLGAQLTPANDAQLTQLLQTAAGAVLDHNNPRALAALTEYVHRNPDQAAAVLSNPAFAPIQADVKNLLAHVTQEFRVHAERQLALADVALNAAAQYTVHPHGPDALLLAQRLAESGQLMHYVRSAEISQAVQEWCGGGTKKRESADTDPVPKWIGKLWRRAPLVVLLLGWLSLAAPLAGLSLLVGADTLKSAFGIWALGFPALVVLQFYVTIRGVRFGKND